MDGHQAILVAGDMDGLSGALSTSWCPNVDGVGGGVGWSSSGEERPSRCTKQVCGLSRLADARRVHQYCIKIEMDGRHAILVAGDVDSQERSLLPGVPMWMGIGMVVIG
jgi:hypothetical protein